MKKIAITGRLASGKSFLLSIFAQMGHAVFNSDEYVRMLYKKAEITEKVKDICGLRQDCDNALIAQKIYGNDDLRKKLESYLHPLVRAGVFAFHENAQNKGVKFCFTEVPLLFETGFNEYFDLTICTVCSDQTKIERASTRKNFSREIFDKINMLQLPESEKSSQSNFVIDTDCDANELERRAKKILEQIEAL